MKPCFRDFMYGMLLTALLILAKGIVERREFGEQLEQMTYNLLQLRLLSSASHASLPLTVVDVSNLVPVPVSSASGTELITPRDALLEIVRAIAARRPRAIGIDVDFSPGADGYMSEADPSFLSACLDIRRGGVPVYVGIYDSVVLAPERWLGRVEFEPLAAYITVPVPERTEGATRMIEWVQPEGVSKRCPSLPYAVAATDRGDVPRPLAWAVERASLRAEREFAVSEFLVDYAPLERLIDERVMAARAADLHDADARITGKIVLVGKATPGRTTDQFVVPGRGTSMPGIYLHASAALTLLQAPLFRLTHAGRVLADLVAALLVFGPILLLRLGWRSWTGRHLDIHRLQVAITAAVVVAVVVAGHFLVASLRLIWTDYLMVVAALLLHAPVERRVDESAEWLRHHVLRRVAPRGMQTEEPRDERHRSCVDDLHDVRGADPAAGNRQSGADRGHPAD